MNMFDNYIVPVFFGGGALALLGLLLFGWALPSFLLMVLLLLVGAFLSTIARDTVL